VAESRPRRIFRDYAGVMANALGESREALDGIQRAVDFHDSRYHLGIHAPGRHDIGDAIKATHTVKSRAGYGGPGDPRIEESSRAGRDPRFGMSAGASGNRVARG